MTIYEYVKMFVGENVQPGYPGSPFEHYKIQDVLLFKDGIGDVKCCLKYSYFYFCLPEGVDVQGMVDTLNENLDVYKVVSI